MAITTARAAGGRETRAFADLREFIDAVEALGQLKRISGANPHLELGAITEVAATRKECPALLFDDLPGYPAGFRVMTNLTNHSRRERLLYGCPLELTDSEAIQWWKDQVLRVEPSPPVTVADGPVKQHVQLDDEVDLRQIPWVQWHEHDGGPYQCATSSVTRDPDSDYVNVGSYRYKLIDHNTMVVHIGSGHHGDVIRKKYWAQGKPCPIAISLGQDPALLITAGTNLAWGQPEYDYAGWLRGAPVEVTPGVVTGLPIPATAEVVLEAEMLPPEDGQAIEGPFGEASGYYGGGERLTPLTRVRAVLRRDDPIVLGTPPFQNVWRDVLSSRGVLVWAELEKLGIPGIIGVNYRWGFTIISIKQSFPGHAMRAGLGCLGGTAGYHGRFVILVDDDVDPFDLDQVLWAVATRCDPGTSIDINRRIWSYRIDPRLEPDKKEKGDYTGSVAIIDATRPYHWREQFPATTALELELRRATEAKWGAILDA
ncbi:MAG TPA: UbiD family decarboxylase [Chloroflexota bacterium]|jgi:4-hydroxy-3-polyprenylbenzoate decarboxylase